MLDTASDKVPRFITKEWIEVNDQSGSAEDRYKPSKQKRLKTSMLRLDLCNYSDAYIVVKGDITLTKTTDRDIIDVRNRFLTFKNNAPFTDCILKINGVIIDNVENLDVVMPMYSTVKFEYSKNYRKTTGISWNYYRDKPNDFAATNYNVNPITNSKSFKYKQVLQEKAIFGFKQFLENVRYAID